MKKYFAGMAATGAILASALPAFAAPPEKVEGFVCPVITTAAVLHSPKAMAIGEGHYSIIGPDVSVPVHATNDNGAGSPGGPHAAPGDSGYTAIWEK